MANLRGLIIELQYPRQKKMENNRSGIQFSQKALIRYTVKNGSLKWRKQFESELKGTKIRKETEEEKNNEKHTSKP